jgi:L-glyceraldehyde 3-phosphate reductase
MLTGKYLTGIPEDSRVKRGNYLAPEMISEESLERVRALSRIAERRGQTLAQLALAWALRNDRVTSALIGASSVAQLEQNVAALERLELDPDELEEIEPLAQDAGINIWATSSDS